MTESLTTAKRRVLDELKRGGPSTAATLAGAMELTDVAVRQHLVALEAAGLVTNTPGPTSPGPTSPAPIAARGRPPTSWSLTERAHSLFPDNHAQLSVELIDAIRQAVGEDGLRRVVDARADAQVHAYRQKVPSADASLGARARALARLRTNEGYMAEVVREAPDRFLLVEHHCPICEAAASCTGICRAEADVFRRVLGHDVKIERVEHVLSGGARCVYRLEPAAASSAGTSRSTREVAG